MKRISLFVSTLSVLFLGFGISPRAFANKADQAACESPPSNGVWHGLARDGEKCICQAGYFNNRRIPKEWKKHMEQLAGKSEINAVITDICTSIDVVKAAAKKQKIVVPEAPKAPVAVPPPTCNAQDITATSNEASNKAICTGPGVSKINRVVTTCDTCKPSIEDRAIVGPKSGPLIYQVDVSKAQFQGQSSAVVVRFFTKDGRDAMANYTVVWPAPVAPPPVVAPPLTPCVVSGGTVGPKGCICLGDLIESNGICIPKPAPPVKVVEDKGTFVHPIIGGFCGYGWSKSFKSGNCYVSPLGLALDISDWLWWYGNVWFGGPGATRVYSDGTPVFLKSGAKDERHYSLAYGTGFLAHLDILGVNVGVIREGHGLTGGITSPTDVATNLVIGAKLILPFDGGRFVIGPNFTVGRNELGSGAPDTMWGVNLQAEVLFFDPHRIVRTK